MQATLDDLDAQADQDHLDTADLRDRVAELARRLRHHRAQEADLIYEAVNLNLGTGEWRHSGLEAIDRGSRQVKNFVLILTVQEVLSYKNAVRPHETREEC